ncbi:hypothetical protein EV360DRAFT_73157 [Lentinula raphanica]|nr:hypothetical protein EV360DRAFT_73157 [Lentinula raphanica]
MLNLTLTLKTRQWFRLGESHRQSHEKCTTPPYTNGVDRKQRGLSLKLEALARAEGCRVGVGGLAVVNEADPVCLLVKKVIGDEFGVVLAFARRDLKKTQPPNLYLQLHHHFVHCRPNLMRRCLPLPNELLHSITEYVAYAPNLQESWLTSFESLSKSASPDLLALSVVDWRLRRICLPFLFANITLKNDEHAKQLENNLALCSRFTDTLVIGRLPALTEIGETIISRLLPQMERLVNVELPECEDRTNLLKALLAHPTVALVLVDQTPSMAMCNHDLSKVTLDPTTSAMAFSLICQKYLDWGMRIKRLILDRPVGNPGLEFQKFPGLKSIEVIKSAGQSSQEWHVMELALDVKSSLTEKLPLVASSFPKLEVLHLNLQYDKGMYDINDLSSALGCFSSLSIVYPQNFRGHLTFKPSIARLMLSIQRDSTLNKMEARARTELFTFASCLVKQGIELDDFAHPTVEWFLKGWLNICPTSRTDTARLGRVFCSLASCIVDASMCRCQLVPDGMINKRTNIEWKILPIEDEKKYKNVNLEDYHMFQAGVMVQLLVLMLVPLLPFCDATPTHSGLTPPGAPELLSTANQPPTGAASRSSVESVEDECKDVKAVEDECKTVAMTANQCQCVSVWAVEDQCRGQRLGMCVWGGGHLSETGTVDESDLEELEEQVHEEAALRVRFIAL